MSRWVEDAVRRVSVVEQRTRPSLRNAVWPGIDATVRADDAQPRSGKVNEPKRPQSRENRPSTHIDFGPCNQTQTRVAKQGFHESRFQQLAQVQRPERAIRIVEPMYRRLSRCEIDRVTAVAVNPVKLRRSGNFNDRQRNSCQRRSWFWRRMGSGIGRGDAPCPTPHHAPPQVRPLRGRNHPSARPEGFVLSGRRPRSEAIPTASMGPGSASSQAPCRAQSRHPGP